MIDQGSRKMAVTGHALILGGILLPLWMIFFYESRTFFGRDTVETAVPIIAACLLILGKALAIPGAIVSGHDGALKTSLYCDIGNILVNGVIIAGVLPLQSAGIIGILSFGATILGFIFFLNYLQGTAEYVEEPKLAAIPGKLYKGCGTLFLTAILALLGIFVGLGGVMMMLFYLLVALWFGAYTYLIGATGYKLLSFSKEV